MASQKIELDEVESKLLTKTLDEVRVIQVEAQKRCDDAWIEALSTVLRRRQIPDGEVAPIVEKGVVVALTRKLDEVEPEPAKKKAKK